MRYREKVVARADLPGLVSSLRASGKRLTFTNGCFDLLHVGHVRYLDAARDAGDVLIVGVNSDASVQRLKGTGRPLVSETARAEVLAALAAVDYVTIFDEETPEALIRIVQPDVLAKGSDWAVDEVVGREIVEARGGHVLLVPVVAGFSTTGLAERIKNS